MSRLFASLARCSLPVLQVHSEHISPSRAFFWRKELKSRYCCANLSGLANSYNTEDRPQQLRGHVMDHLFDDRYLVFVRVDCSHGRDPETNEEPLAECNSYEEARRIKHDSNRDCVIRYAGLNAGGGD